MSGEREPCPAPMANRSGEAATGLPENIDGEIKNNYIDFSKTRNGRPVLTGWPLIEDWMTTLDKGMVSDFNDDINTLLTFAGLFSAVLAGFLIQLYAGLQPSNNQSTNDLLTQATSQLRQISLQLANSSIVPVDIPTPSPSFQASASTIWINTLWFLSLVLSLAAALFGMIAKQWLREYLRWTTMSGSSEGQVALRQGRYEAFMDWKTPAIIASMPVLLELALILFLLGMEVLLWTLNNIVFGICTVAVVTVIVLVVVVTVLPAFRAQCPYKSPVGWICILIKAALCSTWNRCLDLVETFGWNLFRSMFEARGHYLSVVVEKDWRERDLSGQAFNIGEQDTPEDAALAGRQRMLTRALRWILETSQDQRLLCTVDECFAARSPSNRNAARRLAIYFHIACDHLHINPTDLVPPETQCAYIKDGDRAINNTIFWPSSLELRVKQDTDPDRWEWHKLSVVSPPYMKVRMAHMLLSDLLAIVARCDINGIHHLGRQGAYLLQAAAVLSGFLAYSAMREEHRPSVATNRLFELFDCLCHDYARLSPQLRVLLHPVVVALNECESWLPRSRTLTPPDEITRTFHALNVPPGHPRANSWSKSECSLFASLAQYALREWRTKHEHDITKTLLPWLFDRMTACVLRCLDQRWSYCAMGPQKFEWVYWLSTLFDPSHHPFSGQHLPIDLFPHTLTNALRQYRDALLIDDVIMMENLVTQSVTLTDHESSQQAEDDDPHLDSQHKDSSSRHVHFQIATHPTERIGFADSPSPPNALSEAAPCFSLQVAAAMSSQLGANIHDARNDSSTAQAPIGDLRTFADGPVESPAAQEETIATLTADAPSYPLTTPFITNLRGPTTDTPLSSLPNESILLHASLGLITASTPEIILSSPEDTEVPAVVPLNANVAPVLSVPTEVLRESTIQVSQARDMGPEHQPYSSLTPDPTRTSRFEGLSDSTPASFPLPIPTQDSDNSVMEKVKLSDSSTA